MQLTSRIPHVTNGMIILSVTTLMIFATATGLEAQDTTSPPGSPLDGIEVRRVDIVGLVQFDEAYVRNRIRIRAGAPYSQERVQRDRLELFRTERFLDVRAEASLVDGQVNVTLTVVEKPEVAAIEFIGNEGFDRKDLLDELAFAAGDPLDLFEVRQGREAIQRLYREKGYAYVEVGYDEDLLETDQRVVYTIVENQRVRVKRIRFENNFTYTELELLSAIESKRYIPIFQTGDFDPDRAERDAASLQKHYRDRGFLDAEVSYVAEFVDVAREEMEIVFRINEGTRYTVGELIIEGNEVIPDVELLPRLSLQVGEFLIEMRLQSDLRQIEDAYGSRGYIDAVAGSRWVFSSEPGQVILTLAVREGEPYRVGLIKIRGNEHTQDKCARREIRLYPGDIIDETEMRQAERRLVGSGLFTRASRVEAIEPESGEVGARDLLVTVEENPRTNQFIAGVGASSDAGIVGNIILENTNFDIFDTPRDFKEFFRGRSFRGAGQTMRIQLEPGTELTHFRIDFREPYLLDRPVGFGTSAYLFQRGRDGYREERGGGLVSFDRRFEEGLLAEWVGEIALRTEHVGVRDRDSFAAKDIRDVEGGNYLSSVKLSLLHDTTDSRFDPTTGHRFRLSWEQAGAMGGDFYHAKLTGNYTRHWTVAIDELDRRSVVSTQVQVGQIVGDAPVFERFYAGGIGSMRGFAYRGVSPRDGLRSNRVGGDFMVLTGAEYSFPLYEKIVRGVFFTDMGTVEEDFGVNSWRASVGTGIRLTLDIFGTVPMEFDLAWPIAKDEEDDRRVFSFYIGLPFF